MATEPQTTIVVPTIREDCIRAFLEAWGEEFSSAHVIVVEDNPEPTFEMPRAANLTHYSWRDIDAELGESSWIIPRRTDCVRSFGYLKAWQDHGDMIVTLDDDCYPTGDDPHGFLGRHWERLEQPGRAPAWQPTGTGPITRGHPYRETVRERPCVINHGMWDGVPDFDAPTQLLQERMPATFRWHDQTIPVGSYFPMCGMNLAWRPFVTPALYFMLMGRDHDYDRFGDIWAGVFVKKICDHLGYAVHSGSPAIDHQRASNVWANLRKEAAGLEVNEHLWRVVDSVTLTETDFLGCYRQLADALDQLPAAPGYPAKLRDAMHLWSHLFDGYESLHQVRDLAGTELEKSCPTQ